MADFQLTYQDYLNDWNSRQHGSEAGTDQPMPETQWNSMSADARWRELGNRLVITPDDPRYAALKPEVGGEAGRNIVTMRGSPPSGGIVEGGRVVNNNGVSIFSEDSRTPEWQARDEGNNLFNRFLIAAASMVAGGALGGAFSGAADAGAAMASAPGQGFGTALGTGAADAAAATGAAGLTGGDSSALDILTEGEHLTYNTPDYVPPGGDYTDFDMGAPSEGPGPDWPNLPNEGGLDPETASGSAGQMSVRTDGLGSWNSLPWGDRLAGVMNNPGSLLSNSGLIGQLVGGPGGLLDGLSSMPNIPGGSPPGGSPGGGPGGGGRGEGNSGGGPGGGKRAFELTEMNPYAKQKITPVEALMTYLRGAGAK